MKSASVADVKARLSAYLKETRQGPVIVTRNGKPVAVLLAVTGCWSRYGAGTIEPGKGKMWSRKSSCHWCGARG